MVGTMKGRIGTRPWHTCRLWHTCQTTLFNLYPKSLVDKLRHVNDVKLTKEAKLRLKWIEYYEKVKDVTKTCRYFGIECFSMFQISMFLEYTYHTTSMPRNSKKCPWHTSLLEKYIEKYNFVRPHCSLGYRTPAEVAYGNSIKNS